jgi:hypothetical protein
MSCVLCGTQHGNEVRPREQIESLVAQRYREGPFVWPFLMSQTCTNVVCCVHCLNHIRKRKRSSAKHMLPLDQYMLGLLKPGLMCAMDMRSRKRLRKVVSQDGNPYVVGCCLAPLQALLGAKDPVRKWWELNLRTMYFSDGATARVVRQALCA